MYEYVAYIDEAGDPGLKRVLPLDVNGSSEWMIISAVVISRKSEENVAGWLQQLFADVRKHQMRELHFRKLNNDQKSLCCSFIASKEIRIFSVVSNKKNMKGFQNPFAERVSMDANWFYCWLTRMLLERVTNWVEWHSTKTTGSAKKLKVEFSQSGGLSYSQMAAYYELLRMKSSAQRLVLPLGDLKWSVLDRELLEVYPHIERAGLQLADIAASSLFAACDNQQSGKCQPKFAKLLEPRMARHKDMRSNSVSGFGLKLMPSFRVANMTRDQQEIFKFYGYPRQWWDPDLVTQRSW